MNGEDSVGSEVERLRAELIAFVLDEITLRLATDETLSSDVADRLTSPDVVRRIAESPAWDKIAGLIADRVAARLKESPPPEDSDPALDDADRQGDPDPPGKDERSGQLRERPWLIVGIIVLALLAGALGGWVTARLDAPSAAVSTNPVSPNESRTK